MKKAPATKSGMAEECRGERAIKKNNQRLEIRKINETKRGDKPQIAQITQI